MVENEVLGNCVFINVLVHTSFHFTVHSVPQVSYDLTFSSNFVVLSGGQLNRGSMMAYSLRNATLLLTHFLTYIKVRKDHGKPSFLPIE